MLKNKFKIENLEIHVSHGCNFTCTSCAHFSNQGHVGSLSPHDAEKWMLPWSKKIEPNYFSLLGGEPTLNKDLVSIVYLSKELWPNSKNRLVTNGFFLHRHLELPRALSVTKTRLAISIHHDSDEYKIKMKPVRLLVEEWQSKYEIEVVWRESYSNWTKRYHGFGDSMKPYEDENQRASWENCPAKYCPQIYEGMIWKCPPLAYLRLQNKKYKLSEDWSHYLSYKGLSPDATHRQIKEFFYKEDESFCKMCPSSPELIKIDSPLISISDLKK